MPEIREDPVSGRLSLIAPERGQRPTDFRIPEEERREGSRCPFCPGNEELTPPESLRLSAGGGSSSWQVRVVPNRYPALRPDADKAAGDPLHRITPGLGYHEVIIETPEHEKSLESFSPEEMDLVFQAFVLRARAFLEKGRWRYALFFKNRGRRAGASLSHSHSQLMALPFVPPLLERELARARAFHAETGKCLFCRLAREEASGPRLLFESRHFVAFQAFAPRQPLETWILPRPHGLDFLHLEEDLRREFCETLLRVLRLLERTLPGLPYNFFLHLEPLGSPPLPYFHWHLELVPALTRVAGFEWGTEAYIVPLRPEEATAFLRTLKP